MSDIEHAREYLQRARYINARMRAIERQASEIRKDIEGLTATDYSAVRVQSGTHSDISDKLVRLESALSKYNETWNELLQVRNEITDTISQVKDNLLATILFDRYINNLSWNELAKNSGYASSYIKSHLHNEAVAVVAVMLRKKKVQNSTK